ncbi:MULTISPECIES: (2,3-dihydroxybenzoyl)adenylate synthase [Streptomyces]|uniref:(2,3-dihydroxybenzoyl)adenylate synthase n=1 Tax=Streptomyces TaxID=1883 RepID=UPI00093F851A|nr:MULTISPECIES: AMP-binding protein [unclassified Streptomyces]OKJ08667.1 2,3-dihydroxybenzoate--AMP ligase [Streptomyces sp. TSRI0261]QNQ33254.1 AMP-binding protein [Streptomyces sp. CB00271]
MSLFEGRPLDPDVPVIDRRRAAAYLAAGLWREEGIADLLRAARLRHPGRLAVVSGTTRLTHGELHTAVTVTGRRLEGLGVRAGDRVVVQLPNCAEFVVLVLALLDIGAPPVLVLPGFGDYELGHVVRAARPVALAVSAGSRSAGPVESARRLREDHESLDHVLALGDVAAGDVDLAALCDPGAPWDAPAGPVSSANDRPGRGSALTDAAVFLLSGGTTGPPKVIPRGNAGYAYMIRTACGIADVSHDAVYLAVMPAAHGFVLNCPGVLGTLSQGGTVVLGDTTDPRQALGLIERERVTHCALVPTVAMQWLAAAEGTRADLSSLRVLQTGGARPSPELAGRIRPVLGATLQQCYGMSEGLLCYTGLDDPETVVVGTQGRPASPLDEVLIVDERGRPVEDGTTGELLTRGPYTVAGYYRDPAATAKAFTPDGFYRTGDLATRTPGGDLVVNGRVRDIINRGGEKIPAEDLELLVALHPDVRTSAAVGAPHELYGEVVCLYVVPEAGREPTLLELRRYLRGLGLAVWKLPELMEVVTELPTTAIGKIDKKALRADIARRAAVEA